MKNENFLTIFANDFRIPFHKKKLTCLILFCFSIAAFTVSSAAAAEIEVQEAEFTQSKQLIKRAKKLVRKGEFAQAERLLREVLKRNPADTTAKVNLSYVLFKQLRLNEAYNLSIEVAKVEPKNSFAFAVLGVTLLSSGNFKDAKISFINAITLDKEEALAWSGLGLLDFYENRISLGVERLREAVWLEPDEPDFLFALAQVSARAELYKESAAYYKRFLQISPQNDTDRRDRIEGLIRFLNYLGSRQSLYSIKGEKQTKVSFKLVDDRPVIQLKLKKNDAPLNFVLDTGSGISVISERTAKRLKIKPVARGGMARGVGGDGKFEIVYGFLPEVHIGDVKIKGVPIYIRKFHSQNESIDGYIGLSLISKFLTVIDYGDLTFSLINHNVVERKTRENDALSLPLRLTSSGFLSGEVELEGIDVPLNFIVDTGATLSVISDRIANLEEINRFIQEEKLRIIGAAGITENVPTFTLPRVSFGTNTRESVSAIALDLDLINETTGFKQEGILGGNFLKNYRLTFDFKNSQVVFVPIK